MFTACMFAPSRAVVYFVWGRVSEENIRVRRNALVNLFEAEVTSTLHYYEVKLTAGFGS